MSNNYISIFAKSAIIALVLCFISADALLAQRGLIPSLGGARSGTSGFQFLKINTDARSAAMGGATAAVATDASSLFINPALAAQMTRSEVRVGHTAYFADVNMNSLAYVHRMRGMSLGGSLLYLDSGVMEETNEFNPFGTGRTFRTIHMAAAFTFAQELTNLFSYGLTLKYLDERIEEVQAQTVVFDIGFFYRVGDTDLRFAIGLNNFGIDATPSGETTRVTLNGEVTETNFEDVSPPTTFIIGAAYDAYSSENIHVLLTGQLSNPSDNTERFSIGSELTFLNQFYLRTGYQFGIDEAILPSFGVGVNFPFSGYKFGADYGFATRERLGSIHRIAFNINF
jgi:hypothetical protein